MLRENFNKEMASKISQMRGFYKSGGTRSLDFRREQLTALKRFLIERDDELNGAMWKDLRKSPFECAVTEQGMVVAEVDYALENIAEWMKTEKVSTPLINQPGHCEIRREPFGLVLIIGAWNYPINLILAPLVGAIAGGNVSLIKPSEIAPATSAVLAKFLPEYLDPRFVSVLEGGVDETQAILAEPLDFIFFTGSTTVGKIIMAKAAEHLTPVVLELGGKSPAIVLDDSSIDVVAKRIAWGKFMNAGQTCVAPDYIMVLPEFEKALIQEIKKSVLEFYGEDAKQSSDYCRMINAKNFDRVLALIGDEKVEMGGGSDASELYIEPTLLSGIRPESSIMKDEIFGPILPIMTVKDVETAIEFVNSKPKPLALYLFSSDKNCIEKVLNETSSGGVCVNDVVMHMPVPELPFGGVGASGMGNYHGRRSFECFTHAKGILSKGTWPDFSLRYPPYVESHSKWLGFLR